MDLRMATSLVLAFSLVMPVSTSAQFRISSVSVGDVERAVRVGSLIYGIARDARRETAASGSGRTSGGGSAARRSSGSSSRVGARVVNMGDDYLGVPYRWGGNTPSEGFDCSGFVKYVYNRNGVQLPRTSRQQARVGEWLPVNVGALRQGDLMFFASNGSRISHVAIYAGANRILHATSSGGKVRYDDLGTQRGRWFANHFVAARRVADDRGSLVDAFTVARMVFDYFDPPDRAPRPIR
jgi:cell wall-associated NlpC family hydrolase